MRKKQLYAILLAGVMATGSAPTAAFAAEEGIQAASEATTDFAASSSETDAEVPETMPEAETTPEAPQTTPEAETTPEAPQTTPEAETTPEAPQTTPESETTPEAPQTTPEAETTPEPEIIPQAEVPAEQAGNTDSAPSPSITPEEKPEGFTEDNSSGVYISVVGEDGVETTKEYYKTLQYAVNAAVTYYNAQTEEVKKAVVVKIEKNQILTDSITVQGGKVELKAVSDVTIQRADPQDPSKNFKGDLFVVTGADSELQFSAEESGKLTLTGNNEIQGMTATGALVKITEGASFGMSDRVSLINNTVEGEIGAAIDNSAGGNLVLAGGTVSNNKGVKGAVYTTNQILIQGTVTISDNTDPEGNKKNLYLDGETAGVLVTAKMENASVSLTKANGENGTEVIKMGSNGESITPEDFKNAVSQFAYDTEDFTVALSDDGTVGYLKAKEEPQKPECDINGYKITGLEKPLKFFPGKSYKFTVTGAGQDNKDPKEGDLCWKPLYWSTKENGSKNVNWNVMVKKGLRTEGTHAMYIYFRKQIYTNGSWTDTEETGHIKTSFKSAAISDQEWNDYIGQGSEEKDFLTYQSGTLEWRDHNTAVVQMSTTKNCKWYYYFVDAGASSSDIKKKYNEKNAVNSAKKDTPFWVKAEKVPEKDSWLIVAAAADGKVEFETIKLNNKKRPAATPTVTTRAPRTYKVSQSKVTGLENPLKFYPRKFYDFTVTGAGQNDKDPISGDERWIPLYWSMSVNGSKNTSWRIGSQENGIRKAEEYPLYIFFKKQTFNGSEWVDTDVVEYMKTSFRSAEITDEEWKAYIEEYNKENPDDGLNYDGTGAGSVADIDPTEAADQQDAGSVEKTAAKTADPSPVGSMSALAALSLLTGGYVIVRKRKKEEI